MAVIYQLTSELLRRVTRHHKNTVAYKNYEYLVLKGKLQLSPFPIRNVTIKFRLQDNYKLFIYGRWVMA